MVAMKQMAKHPVKTAETASCQIAHQASNVAKKPLAIGGLVLAGLGVAAFIYVWPELHRYIRMERM